MGFCSRLAISLVLALGCSSSLSAQGGGALPKGAYPAGGGQKGPENPGTPQGKRRSCFLDLADPPGGSGQYDASGSVVWLLAQVTATTAPQSQKKSKSKAAPKTVKHTLLKIDVPARKAETVLSFDHGSSPSLLTLGSPVHAIGSVAFAGLSAGCFEGPASVVTVAFSKKDRNAVSFAGSYRLVNSPASRMLADMKKNTITEIDGSTFQSKLSRKAGAHERPLFYDPGTGSMASWHDDGTQRGLVFYAGEAPEATRRLAVAKGDRVLQDGDRFAIATPSITRNTIEIRELPEWSGVKKAGSYKVKLPPAYPVTSAGVTINIEKGLAIVYGANFLAKQRWQRAFVFNYRTGENLGGVAVTGTDYISYSAIAPGGDSAFFEIRDMSTRRTVGAKTYNVTKKQFDDVELGLPAP